jgi:hypothetical protein
MQGKIQGSPQRHREHRGKAENGIRKTPEKILLILLRPHLCVLCVSVVKSVFFLEFRTMIR